MGGAPVNRTDMALAIERTLNTQENLAIVDAFVRMNPAYRGATTADVLDLLDGTDSHLSVIEPLVTDVELMTEPIDPVTEPGLFGGAVRATYLMTGSAPWPEVANLIERVRAYLKRAPEFGGSSQGEVVAEAGTGETLTTEKVRASGHDQPDVAAAELARMGYRLCKRCQRWQTIDPDQVCGECRAAGRA